jgi:hypothetical protein
MITVIPLIDVHDRLFFNPSPILETARKLEAARLYFNHFFQIHFESIRNRKIEKTKF